MRVPTPIFVVAFVLALPVLLPCALVSNRLYRRRLRTVAESHACPSCGSILGFAALLAGDEHWRAYVADLHRLNPGVRFRLVRLVDAICTACGAQLHFREASGTFMLSGATAEPGAPADPGHGPRFL